MPRLLDDDERLMPANHWYRQPPRPVRQPRLPHISAGGQEVEEWEAGEVGGEIGSGLT